MTLVDTDWLEINIEKVRIFLSKNEDMKSNLVKSVKLFCGLRLYFGKHILKFFLDNVVLKDEGYIIINKIVIIIRNWSYVYPIYIHFALGYL